MRSFLGDPSGNVPVFSALWFDSGYSLRQFTISVWQQRQVRTVQTVLVLVSARSHLFLMRKWPRSSFSTVVLLVLPGTMHLALCWHFTLYSVRLCCLCTDRGDPTGAVLGYVIDMPVVACQGSSTSPSWRRGRFPWSSEQIMRFPCCSPLIRWSMSWVCRSWVQAVRSQSRSLRCC